MLASIGFVREEELNILPMKIGEVDGNSDVYDLAVIYTKTAVCFFLAFSETFISLLYNSPLGFMRILSEFFQKYLLLAS